MPCAKCNADFNLLNWKSKCYECEENYCSKCLQKIEGETYCDVCEVLIKRPPNRLRLLMLKSKDLQLYLNRHNISTHGIVEKAELVDLFYRYPIPIRPKRHQRKFTNPLSGSVPNIPARSYFNNIRTTAEAAFNNRNWNNGHSAHNSPYRTRPPTPPPPAPPPPPFQPRAPSYVPPSAPPPHQSYSEQNFRTRNEQSSQRPRKLPKLSDFQSSDDLNELSVKQLKELLTLNRVDYKGCVEKTELLERANRLWNDSNHRKADESGDNVDEFCKICMDAPLDCVLLECGHIATCIDCGKRLAECPICRQYVTRVVRTFKA